MSMLRPAGLCAVFTALLLGCSSVGLLYRQLDWLIPWYLDDYLELSDAQQTLFDDRLTGLLDWHRREQLPRYAELLRQWRDDVADGLDETELNRQRRQLQGVWADLIRRLGPELDDFTAQLSRQQIEQVFTRLRERHNREFQEKYIEGPVEERSRRRQQRLEKQLRRWLGPLTGAQQLRLAEWSLASVRDAEHSLDYRRLWQNRLRELLLGEAGVGRREALTELLLEPEQALRLTPQLSDWRQRRRQRFDRLLLEIDTLSTSAQRRRLLDRLDRLSEDFFRIAGS